MSGLVASPSTFAQTRKLMLVASTGGHLAELLRLHPLLNATEDSVWITFRTAQSEALLAGRRVFYVRYVRPRDVFSILIVFWTVLRMLSSERFDGAISTGSGIALACFPAAMLRRIPTQYIESLARVQGPSTTGRVLARLRRTAMFTQTQTWGHGVWRPHPSVLSTFRSVPRSNDTSRPRLFVTLGTIEGFRFDALIDAVLATGLADDRTVWQVGSTVRTDMPGTIYTHMSSDDFSATAREADVVISHAGVGSLLVLLEEGIYPILVTRRASRNEHVDDHQTQLAAMVNSVDVGRVVDAPDLTAQLVHHALSRRIEDGQRPEGELAEAV